MLSKWTHTLTTGQHGELFQRYSRNKVQGITGEDQLQRVDVFLSFSSLRFWKSYHRSLLWSRFSGGRRTSPSLSNHAFPLSSELRKRWLVSLCLDKGANFHITNSTVLSSKHFLSTGFDFPDRAQKSGDSPTAGYGKQRKANLFLRADEVSSVSYLSETPTSSRPCARFPCSTSMQSRERHKEKACNWLPWANRWGHLLSKAALRKARGCSACEVRARIRDRVVPDVLCVDLDMVCIWGDDVRRESAIQEARLSSRWLSHSVRQDPLDFSFWSFWLFWTLV